MDLMEIWTLVTTIVTIASAVTAATPTPKDDAVMGKYIYPIVEYMSLTIGKAKQQAGEESKDG